MLVRVGFKYLFVCPPRPARRPRFPPICFSPRRRIFESYSVGLLISGRGTQCIVHECDVSDNGVSGVSVEDGADPHFASCRCGAGEFEILLKQDIGP